MIHAYGWDPWLCVTPIPFPFLFSWLWTHLCVCSVLYHLQYLNQSNGVSKGYMYYISTSQFHHSCLYTNFTTYCHTVSMHKWHKSCYFRNKEVNNSILKCRLKRDVRIIQIYILSKEGIDGQLLLKWLKLSCIRWPFWNEEVFKDSLTHTLTLSSGIYFTFPASVAGSRWGSWCPSCVISIC